MSCVPFLPADFGSAFNRIKTDHLAKKAIMSNTMPKFVICITNLLCHRKQYIQLKGVLHGECHISTRVPQGCVLSSVLFTQYTSDCMGTDYPIFIEYYDDTEIADL